MALHSWHRTRQSPTSAAMERPISGHSVDTSAFERRMLRRSLQRRPTAASSKANVTKLLRVTVPKGTLSIMSSFQLLPADLSNTAQASATPICWVTPCTRAPLRAKPIVLNRHCLTPPKIETTRLHLGYGAVRRLLVSLFTEAGFHIFHTHTGLLHHELE